MQSCSLLLSEESVTVQLSTGTVGCAGNGCQVGAGLFGTQTLRLQPGTRLRATARFSVTAFQAVKLELSNAKSILHNDLESA